MHITTDDLRTLQACNHQVERFSKIFHKRSVAVTRENLVIAYVGELNLHWLSGKLLDSKQRADMQESYYRSCQEVEDLLLLAGGETLGREKYAILWANTFADSLEIADISHEKIVEVASRLRRLMARKNRMDRVTGGQIDTEIVV